MIYSSGKIGESEDDGRSSIGKDDVYSSKGEEPVLASLSDLYLELEIISVNINGPSSYPTLHYLLTTYTTDYCSGKNIHNFDLRKMFYSKQDLIDTCHSPA